MSSASSYSSQDSSHPKSEASSSDSSSGESTQSDESDVNTTIAVDVVVTKYKMAGDIVNRVLQQILEKCIANANVRELCELGDRLIIEETDKVYRKVKALKKGVASPTCISVNNCCCNYSPVTDTDKLRKGDVVKVDLGAHVDGFIAVAAHTIVVGASKTSKVKGRKADAILAAHFAYEASLRLFDVGNESNQIPLTIQKMCEVYKCKPIEGMSSHKMGQFKIHGKKEIIQNPTEEQKDELEKFQFGVNEVFDFGVLASSGEGTCRENRARGTIFMKTDVNYQLKRKSSRAIYSEIVKNHSPLLFHIRDFEDQGRAKLGLIECVNHNVVTALEILYEKATEFVAQFRCTVLLMPNGPHRITGLPFDLDLYESEYTYLDDPHLSELMSRTGNPMRARKKKIQKIRRQRVKAAGEAP